MRDNTSTQLYLEISPARNPRSPFPWPRPCYCHPRKETRHSSNARTLQRRCSLPKDTTVLKVSFHVQCTSTPEFLFKQITVTNGCSNCRYNIFGDRIKQCYFFRFVLHRNTGKVTFKWGWGMKLQCWGTPLFWFLQSDSDQVAKFVPKRQKQPCFGRNAPRVYFTCFSLIYQKHCFEVDPVNCSIKPTSQEAKQLHFPCTPRDIRGISFPNFLWRPGCKEAGPCNSSITSNKESNKDLSKYLRHLPIAKHHGRKTGRYQG